MKLADLIPRFETALVAVEKQRSGAYIPVAFRDEIPPEERPYYEYALLRVFSWFGMCYVIGEVA